MISLVGMRAIAHGTGHNDTDHNDPGHNATGHTAWHWMWHWVWHFLLNLGSRNTDGRIPDTTKLDLW